ncbi:fimbrial protein [Pseudomonas mucidolens]|uniref:Pilin (Type 1 fimbria component protein) n=1 Tax=Pseudomonas mucidolens TaxID=46679 RepID=A0A1H2N345_9PSED|nr:hypothetical protein [Pseudomonas mucidolens]SDU99581.1 Pilin (type 1 fimbria component protein) [Pseudomonas mucidolens]SQH32768.1 putative fimbrial protein [Pseudomonas mucidolens]
MIRSIALSLIPLTLFMVGEPARATEAVSGGALKGRVQLAGSIVDSACTIRVGNESQTISFKPTVLSGLVSGDSTSQQPINIYVSDCTTYHALRSPLPPQLFKLSFEGETDGKHFGTQGTAQGIALQIKDEHGKLISPGMLLDHSMQSADILILNYYLTLVGSGHVLKAGDYHATIKLNIQHF